MVGLLKYFKNHKGLRSFPILFSGVDFGRLDQIPPFTSLNVTPTPLMVSLNSYSLFSSPPLKYSLGPFYIILCYVASPTQLVIFDILNNGCDFRSFLVDIVR